MPTFSWRPAWPAHRQVFAAFFIYSFGFGGFYPRLAELQRGMGIGEAELGLGLIGIACGTLVSLTFGAPVVERLGHRRTLLALLPLVPVVIALAAHARGPATLFVVLLPAGLAIGLVEMVVNLEADRVEHAHGRRIMNRAHAFWSFGFFGGGLAGTLAARAGVSPQWQLALTVPLVALLVAALLGRFQAAPPRPNGHADAAAPRFARPTGAIGLLVVLTLSALVLEGAGADWSAIFMRDALAAPAWMGALAVTTGALAQALARYVADRFVERHSARAVARTLLALLGAGCLLVTLAPAPLPALAGFALMGVGTSALFPLAMSAAAQRTDRPAAANVAALAQTSFVAFLLAPPLLGFVAEHWGIRASFGVGLPLVAASLLVAGVLGVERSARR